MPATDATRRRSAGHPVISMAVGQPVHPAPRAALEAARAALADGRISYTEALGLQGLRAEIAAHYRTRHGVDVDPGRIAVTTGSSAGFNLAFLTLFDAGDRVAIARPGYRLCDLFEATKTGLEARGYGRYIPGRIGHGIGLGAHEHPSIDAATQIPLEPGMILTLEPNIRIPSEVATQISDTILVTEGACEFLTRSTGGLLQA